MNKVELHILLALGLVAGCSSDAQPAATGSAGASGGGSVAMSSGGAAGTSSTTASGSGGSPINSAGTAGAPTAAAGSASVGGGGAASGGNGGSAGHGGASGNGGTGNGGAGGASGGATPAAALDKFRFECPCKPGAADQLSNGDCNVTMQTDRQTATKTMGGDSGTVYNVTLRVRGLSEPNTYMGGMLDPNNNRFYTGGTATSADGGGFTSYMMTVVDPAQHYFFNYNPTVSDVHFLLDYTVTVKIRGGTTVTFDVDSAAAGSHPDGVEVGNHDQLVVPDVPPAPNWYDGQFIQLDVVSTQPAT